MNILITGSKGFVGDYLFTAISNTYIKHNIVGIDKEVEIRALMSGCKIIQSDCIIKPIPNTEETTLCES